MFQAAMGWANSHLHNFRIGDALYGAHFDEYPPEEIDEKEVMVLQALRVHKRFVYEYDFGDSWEHEVEVEAMSTMRLGLKFAVCLEGQNACPPEDCGGPPGYSLMLEALGDSSHEEHEDLLRWLGGPFDPEQFDLAAANAALQRLR
jgi:pRiA4b ORF-3-like protein